MYKILEGINSSKSASEIRENLKNEFKDLSYASKEDWEYNNSRISRNAKGGDAGFCALDLQRNVKYDRRLILPLSTQENFVAKDKESKFFGEFGEYDFENYENIMFNLKKDFHMILKNKNKPYFIKLKKAQKKIIEPYIKTKTIKTRALHRATNIVCNVFRPKRVAAQYNLNGGKYFFATTVSKKQGLTTRYSQVDKLLFLIDSKSRIAVKNAIKIKNHNFNVDNELRYKNHMLLASRLLTVIMVVNKMSGKYYDLGGELRDKISRGVSLQLVHVLNDIDNVSSKQILKDIKSISLEAANLLLSKMELEPYREDYFTRNKEAELLKSSVKALQPAKAKVKTEKEIQVEKPKNKEKTNIEKPKKNLPEQYKTGEVVTFKFFEKTKQIKILVEKPGKQKIQPKVFPKKTLAEYNQGKIGESHLDKILYKDFEIESLENRKDAIKYLDKKKDLVFDNSGATL